MTASSLMAGTYAPPAVHDPSAAAQQQVDPLAGEQLAALTRAGPGRLRPAERRSGQALVEVGDEGLVRGDVVGEVHGRRIGQGAERGRGHAYRPPGRS